MENVTIFVDGVGRMLIGQINEKASDKTSLAVTNPAVVNIQADQQSGNISVQLLPFVFSEFITSNESTWKFSRNSVVISDDIKLDERVIQQYNQIVNAPKVQSVAAPYEPEVIKLFDE